MPGSKLKFKLNNPIILTLDCVNDLENATAYNIMITKPDFTQLTISAELVTGTNRIRGILPGDDVDQLGQWSARPLITVDYDVNPLDGDEVEFVVRPRNRTEENP